MRAPTSAVTAAAAVLLVTSCSSGSPDPARAEADGGPASASAPCDGEQLESVTLTDTGDALRVQWEGPAPSGDVLWSIMVNDEPYEAAYQVGTRGDGAFVFDLIAAQNADLPLTPETSADSVTLDVPWTDLPGLKGDLRWTGTLSVNGQDVATCPAPGDDLLNPAKVTLERD